jgi:hypothetical protein
MRAAVTPTSGPIRAEKVGGKSEKGEKALECTLADARKNKKQSWNVYDGKGLLFFESP